MSQLPFARIRQLASSALLLLAACQSTHDPGREPISDGTQPLCGACAPRAGGETSDFGNACWANCGEIEPARALTDEELHEFGVERALALVRDGLVTQVGWLPHAFAKAPSHTAPSTLYARFQPTGELQISNTEHCGPRIVLPVRAELETSDGALQATVTGTFYNGGDGVWYLDLGADLADVRGTADLRLADAWAEVKGAGQREGELQFSLQMEETLLYGTIQVGVGYARFPRGLTSLDSRPPRTGAPIYGHFPMNRCAPEVATPIDADQPLPEADGRSAAELAQEAYAFVAQQCAARWSGAWRDAQPGEFTLELDRAPVADVCFRRFPDTFSISWQEAGSFGSADGELRAEIRRATVIMSEGAVSWFQVEGSFPPTDAPTGSASCAPTEEGDTSWSSYVQVPHSSEPRSCLSTREYDRCTAVD